ncbi:hypothetical protein Tco_0151323 [Tanacetum coccineum]
MAFGGSDWDAKDALSKLLQRGTVAEYQSEFEILINRVTWISEGLLKTFYISGLKLALQCALLRSNPKTLDEAFSLARATEARFTDLQLWEILSNGSNDSETSGLETPAKEVVDNGNESEVVAGLPEEFQEGDMVDTLSRAKQKRGVCGDALVVWWVGGSDVVAGAVCGGDVLVVSLLLDLMRLRTILCPLISHKCHIKNKDIREFLDGVWPNDEFDGGWWQPTMEVPMVSYSGGG